MATSIRTTPQGAVTVDGYLTAEQNRAVVALLAKKGRRYGAVNSSAAENAGTLFNVRGRRGALIGIIAR